VYAKPNAYSTDYLRDHAITFIESTPQDQPVFVHYSPFAPHGGQKAATRHRKTFPNLAPRRPPSYNEADVSDKTAYVQSFPLASSTEQALYDKGYKKTMQTLPAVDEAVDAIVDALEAAGRLNDTIIVFTSDNGLQWGEHRLFGIKSFPYEESIRVPFIVRYDALGITPRSDPRFVLNIDLAPTFADLAGVETPGVEGQSFLPLLSDPETPWRTDFMIENAYKTILTYCGVRNEDYTYVYHSSGEEELYDLAADPYQMSNVASSPSMAETVSALRARTAELCQPPPPKWSPPLG
jgi:arylsulfatase A-like enzyme